MNTLLFSRQYVEKRNPQDGADFATQVASLLSVEGIDAGDSSTGEELIVDGGASGTVYASSTSLDPGGA